VDKTAAMSAAAHPRRLRAAESALQEAMVAGDADRIDELLHSRATFSGPDGELVSREAHLARYRQGALMLRAFDELDRQVRVEGSTGVTLVLAGLSGSYHGRPFVVRLRLSRTWVHDGEQWRMLSVHGSRAPVDKGRRRPDTGLDPASGPGQNEPLDGDGEAFVLI
jgi:hypothetical protein